MTIKAAVVGYGMVLSNVETKEVDAIEVDDPSFSMTCTDRLIITCSSHPEALIYYTKTSGDGTQAAPADPDPANHVGTLYEAPLSLNVGDKVKAIACVSAAICSGVSDYLVTPSLAHTEEPTIERTAFDEVTITGPDDSKIYYTTNGEDPEVSGEGYDSPVILSDVGSSLMEIRAVAVEEGMEASCVSRRFMVPQPTSVTVTDEDCTSTSPQCNKLVVTLPEGVTNARYAVTAGNGSAAPSIDAIPNPYVLYTEGLNLDYLDGSNEWYTVHVYAVKSSDHSYQAESVSHEMKTSGKPVLTPPVGSSPVIGISGGVFGDVAVCTIDMGTPEDDTDDIVATVPIASDGTASYSIPNNAVGTLTVAFRHGVWQPSCGATYVIPAAPAKPTWSQDCHNILSLHCSTPMADIHYEIGDALGSEPAEPTLASPTYVAGCLDNLVVDQKLRAKAFLGFLSSPTLAYTYAITHCPEPQFFVDGTVVTISVPGHPDADIFYNVSTNGVEPEEATIESTPYTEAYGLPPAGIAIFSAVAVDDDLLVSCPVRAVTREGYTIYSVSDLNKLSAHPDKYFFVQNDINASGYVTTVETFTGVVEGNMHTISGLTKPLFGTATDAVIHDLMLDNISIDSTGNAGAIAQTANGATRIYNCGILSTGSTQSTVTGTDKVGGLVGELDESARVINCFSYANITGGAYRSGIVGYNDVASTSGNLQTMVMNCMFYGDISKEAPYTKLAPIYGGEIIHNKRAADNNTGLNNYCFFYYHGAYLNENVSNISYNGSLGAEERFLNRFEFFRMTLNSTRNLAAFYVSGHATEKDLIAKWVLDESIAPYPILKDPGYYPSLINFDAEHAVPIDPDNVHYNEGRKLGELTVNIQKGNGGAVFNNNDYSSITTDQLILNVIDKDPNNFNFNYKKIQLPYYNQVGSGNYTHDRVVTGWKIVAISPSGSGSFTTTTADYPDWNFVDRTCTDKDLYSVSGRVFNQGAYYEVPDGVTSITIQPYWAKAVFLSDANYDVTYDGANKYPVTVAGNCPTPINEQTVYNSVSSAMTALGSSASHTVYDYAVVLVGNYHQYADDAIVPDIDPVVPVTFMSADFDGDLEPDNTLFYYHKARQRVAPIRFDFLNIPGIGTVKRTWNADTNPQPGIFKPYGWFEVTNTVFVRFGQFEYADDGSASGETFTKVDTAPLILLGGIYEQFVSGMYGYSNKTNYMIIGDNAWFKNFANGCHTNRPVKAPKMPINVTGGDYQNFYLTGIYQPGVNPDTENAECYIDGGRFGEVAGAGMQLVKGNVTWLINAADIEYFFGGGINHEKSITGHVTTTISNSRVDEFYGGPKFGAMQPNKLVSTTATNCRFGLFFGAGHGGSSLNRVGCEDKSEVQDDPSWNTYVDNHYSRSYEETHHSNNGSGSDVDANGVSTSYDYEFILHSDGKQTVARFFVNFASLSLASTKDVVTELTGCTIGTFYGGGRLGTVEGNVESTLTDCTVEHDVFGSGYSANVPTIEIMNKAYFVKAPHYNRKAGVFNDAEVQFPAKVPYTWDDDISKFERDEHGDLIYINDNLHLIYTNQLLDNLGAVEGNATLTINGNSVVHGDVYGGGAMSSSNTGTSGGTTQVNIDGGSFGGNIYGGGMGSSEVAVTEDVVEVNIGNASQSSNNIVFTNLVDKGSVFGCNNINGTPKGDVTVNIYVTKHDEHNAASYTGSDATFAIADVFGGGNEANYEPSATTNKATVNIFGCENTVRRVFGGGNAAAAGSSTQDIDGVYTNIEGGRFYQVFGGGNGERGEDYGADIYGDVNLGIHGGNVGQSFGGSNQHGTITGDINIVVDNTGPCEENNLLVNEFFCGGNYVDITGNLVTDILCSDGMEIENLYGGCNQADISGNVVLNVYGGIYTNVFAGSKGDSITQGSGHINKAANILGNVTLNLYGGTIENAFGGSNVYGNINGRIVVNVLDEEGSCPLYVTNIYGGSNETNYTPTSALVPDHVSPIVNVIHAKYGILGNVYGGSKGIANAVGDDVTTVTAYPLVNIGYDATSMEQYIPEDELGNNVYTVPAYPRAIISGSVFGGGDAAKIDGNTVIYLRNRAKVFGNIYGGGNMGEVTGDTKVIVNGANE